VSELLAPVDLCTPDGALNPRARGWSRRPLHRCNLGARWRLHRWDHWCVIGGDHLLSITVADLGFLSLAAVVLADLRSGRRFEMASVAPFSVGLAPMPETVGGGPIRVRLPFLRVDLEETAEGTRLFARTRTLRERVELDVMVAREPALDTLNVVVPWSERRFHFTSKQIGLPASGAATWNGARIPLGDAIGYLDFGRGRWPSEKAWNWGAAAGDGVALNLGARWTDGTGATENALWLDGRLHPISETVRFSREAPGWRVRGPGIDLQVRPLHERLLKTPLACLDWSAGTWHGLVTADDGARAELDGAIGFAEAFDARF
jgi:hypothetical protein